MRVYQRRPLSDAIRDIRDADASSGKLSAEASLFDLSGRRIVTGSNGRGAVLTRGMYILNGRKVVVR